MRGQLTEDGLGQALGDIKSFLLPPGAKRHLDTDYLLTLDHDPKKIARLLREKAENL